MKEWEEFLVKQETDIGKKTVDKWLRSLKILRFDALNLYLEAKDSFHLNWFKEHFHPNLAFFQNKNHKKINVHVSVCEKKKVKTARSKSSFTYKITSDPIEPYAHLDNFVVSEKNSVAFKLLCELSGYKEKTLPSFNPIFLYGSKGCGKSHLLMACARAFLEKNFQVMYVKANTFTQHVIQSFRKNTLKQFRDVYRNIDLLLIDNVDHLAFKNATQEEFFHTFNFLHMAEKQIILTSVYPPGQLEGIEPRLISRFEWGISCHLEKLTEKNFLTLLEKKLHYYKLNISENMKKNILQLFHNAHEVHHVVQLLAFRSLHDELTDDMALLYLKDYIAKKKETSLDEEKIIKIVAQSFGLKKEDLLGLSQTKECSFPRQIAIYFIRKLLQTSFPKIGKTFKRDHSTIMNSYKQIKTAKDLQTKTTLQKIENLLS